MQGNQINKWKNRIWTLAVYLLLAASCLICYGIGVTCQRELKPYADYVTLVRTDGNACSLQEAEQMRRRSRESENPLFYTLWGSEGERILQNPGLGRNTRAEILALEGSSVLLQTSDVILDGTAVRGCLVGEDIARELFGTPQAAGLSVTLEGCEYQVLGMLRDAPGCALFQAVDLEDVYLDRMNIRISEDVPLSSLEQQMEWETGGTWEALDYRFFNSLLEFMGVGLCLLFWLFFLRLLWGEWRRYRRQCAKNVCYYENGSFLEPAVLKGTVFRLTCVAGAVVLFGLFLRFHIRIPEELIPARWSDFEFWGRLYDEKSIRILEWISCEKRTPEMSYMRTAARSTVYLALAYLFYGAFRAIRFGRIISTKKTATI